ncbi:MAG: HD domain-containing protein [Pirellulales bacterium]|nr:HD domain-containing protein [Pirellulales bacterium]
MAARAMPVVALSEMAHGDEADLFVLLTAKEELTTRDGKPYFKVTFRDARREVSFPIWDNSPWAADCRDRWTPGAFYKLRAVYRETNYGPQLDIRKIRETIDDDAADGFDPAMCVARSRFEPEDMFADLLGLIRERIGNGALRALVESVLVDHREAWLTQPAARHNHHAYAAGLLEHTLSVTQTCVYLADKYAEYYPEMTPPLDPDLVVAGGVLHDVGKIRELRQDPTGTTYTPEGELIGHLLQGRDMLREAAAAHPIDNETLLRLEHLLLAHQRLPEWGSPKPPMTPEALLVHYADDVDAKFHMMAAILRDDTTPGPVTSRKNALGHKVFRGSRG